MSANLDPEQMPALKGRASNQTRGHGLSGQRVLATLALTLLATAVVPPLGAFAVSRARVRSAEAAVQSVAQALRQDEPRLLELTRGAEVLCGRAGR